MSQELSEGMHTRSFKYPGGGSTLMGGGRAPDAWSTELDCRDASTLLLGGADGGGTSWDVTRLPQKRASGRLS